MAALLLPLAISPRISDSRGVSHDRSDFRRDDLRLDELVDDLRVDHRPAWATVRMAWASSSAPATRSFSR